MESNRIRNLFCGHGVVMKMFHIFIGVVVSLVCRSVKTHRSVHSKLLHSMEHKF